MRLFVVLAVVAFTGCQANVLKSDESKPQLEVVKDAFWEYFVKATKAAQDSLQTFGESEFGQEVSTKIKDSVAVARQYAAIAENQLSAIGRAYGAVTKKVEWLFEHLLDITEVRALLESYTGKMRPTVASYRQALEQKLRQKCQELLNVLWQGIEQLLPSTEALTEQVNERLWKFLVIVIDLL